MNFLQRISIVPFTFFLIILLSSCSVLSDAERLMEDFQDTAREIEIGLEKGLTLLETGEALATQIIGNGIIQTAIALPTQLEGSGLVATAQSLATSEGPSLLLTAQNFTTYQVPKIEETIKAIATRIPIPADIPIFPGNRTELFYEQDELRYRVDADIEEVFEYYDERMQILGWKYSDDGLRIENNDVVIDYRKGDRSARLWLSFDRKNKITGVRILISHE